MFIYLITNTINGKQYVGQTTRTIEIRWKDHKHHKDFGTSYLHKAIKKYGEENFIREIVCEPLTLESMNDLEREYIEKYNTLSPNGYNLTKGGEGSLGLKHTDEAKEKMSRAAKGRIRSAEHALNISIANTGKKLSEETKVKLSIAAKNKQREGSPLKGRPSPLRGRKLSLERRKEFSKILLGNKRGLKLSSEQASEIRRLYFTGNHKQREIAAMFSICRELVSNIVRYKAYKNAT
jgi:group I intron endonuclease